MLAERCIQKPFMTSRQAGEAAAAIGCYDQTASRCRVAAPPAAQATHLRDRCFFRPLRLGSLAGSELDAGSHEIAFFLLLIGGTEMSLTSLHELKQRGDIGTKWRKCFKRPWSLPLRRYC
jgi:hypothetical protein